MANDLYWISALTYAVVLLIILWNDFHYNKNVTEVDKAFRLMVIWVVFFCIQDTIWGMCETGVIKGDRTFFVSSEVFHLSTVTTTFFWLNYVLTYLGKKMKHKRRYLLLDGIVILFEALLVIINCFRNTLFTIVDGTYVTGPLRPLTFANQYVIYLLIGVVTLVYTLKEKGQDRERYWSVFVFALAPILLGLFQLLYPDGPFYSLGYFLGVFIVHIFVVAKEREEKNQLDLILKSNTDELTGLYNRRAFETEVMNNPDVSLQDNMVFISMDVNGLKVTNDTLGHAAGDELLIGATSLMKKSFGGYGKVYRTGGDEFCAVIFATSEELDNIKQDFEAEILAWTGELVKSVSVSCGYVEAYEVESGLIHDISILADKRMYESKSAYYRRKGFDRRGQREAHTALTSLYTKIIMINLTEDTYQIVNMNYTKEAAEDIANIPPTISGWLYEFGNSGKVHPEDLEEYYSKTNVDYMRHYFKRNKKPLTVFYRRKNGKKFNQVMMEIIPTSEYTNSNQTLFMYVKNIDRQ